MYISLATISKYIFGLKNTLNSKPSETPAHHILNTSSNFLY